MLPPAIPIKSPEDTDLPDEEAVDPNENW
jgi:hypothetical protein